MKKLLIICSVICLLTACRKDPPLNSDIGDNVSTGLLDAARKFHAINIAPTSETKGASGSKMMETFFSKSGKTLKLFWDDARSITLSDGTQAIAVPTEDFKLTTKNYSLFRQVIFVTKGEQIVEGNIIEFYGTPEYIESHKEVLLRSYKSENIPGFEGTVITFDLKYRQAGGFLFEGGKRTSITTKIVQGAKPTASGINTNISPIKVKTDSVCYAVYWVSGYYQGGYYYEDWTYLYSYCTGNDGGGGGGGGSTTNYDLWKGCYDAMLARYIADIESLAGIRDAQIQSCYTSASGSLIASLAAVIGDVWAVLWEARRTGGASLGTLDPGVAAEFLNDIILLISTADTCITYWEGQHYSAFWARYYVMKEDETYCSAQYPW